MNESARVSKSCHPIQGQLLRLSEHRAVAIYLRDGSTWVADFVDGQGVLIDVNTWFRFNCGTHANTYVSRRITRESALPLPEELVAQIEALHCACEPVRSHTPLHLMKAIFALLPRSRMAMLLVGRSLARRPPQSRSLSLVTTTFNDQENIMNSRQRQQLVESYSREHGGSPQAPMAERNTSGRRYEPISHLALTLKCAACVAVVALLVVIGSGEDKAGMGKDARSNAARTASATKSAAAADRKEVFDARRARFEGNDPVPGKRYAVAVAPPDPANAKGIADATCSGGVDGGMDASGSECGKGAAAAAR